MKALNESTEKELYIPIHLTNVPRNVIVTTELPKTFRITVKDKGFVLLTYIYGEGVRPIGIDFKTYSKGDGHGVVNTSDLLRQVLSQMVASSKITSVRPDKLEFYYNYGLCKKVPVLLAGKITLERMFYLARVRFWPDSVTIYASRHILDSVKAVHTLPLNYSNLSDTMIIRTRLVSIKGVKCVPEKVRVGLYPDIFTDVSMEVPIVGINMPEGKVLRTFPSKVQVSFITGVGVYRDLRPEDFKVVVDYNELSQHPSDKCNVRLTVIPHGISRVNISVKQVDYLIEQE